MAKFHAWADIENFHNVRKTVTKYTQLLNMQPTVRYKAKVKLHGTNAAVQISPDGEVCAQSRTAIITTEHDNAGFARWVKDTEKSWQGLANKSYTVLMCGEWCGPGIMKGVAISQIPQKIFAVFALRLIADATHEMFIVDPTVLREFVSAVPNVHVIDWYDEGKEFEVEWLSHVENFAPVLKNINECVENVEKSDPWVKKTFNVDGIGEGLVFYPVSPAHSNSYKSFSDLSFKAKGALHQTVNKTKPVQADPTVMENAKAFAEMTVTAARLEQGARSVSGGELIFDAKNTGAFIKWIVNDVHKETSAELAASGLDEKTVNKACSERARLWYLDQIKKT